MKKTVTAKQAVTVFFMGFILGGINLMPRLKIVRLIALALID